MLDLVRQADGDYGAVQAVGVALRTQPMCNLTVATDHTFFVGDGLWLVHNADYDYAGCGVDLIHPDDVYHILYGGPGDTGHLRPGGPDSTPFPEDWSAEKILDETADIVTSKETTWYVQLGPKGRSLYTNAGNPARWVAWKVRDGVRAMAAWEPVTGKVYTSFPDNDPIPAAILQKEVSR